TTFGYVARQGRGQASPGPGRARTVQRPTLLTELFVEKRTLVGGSQRLGLVVPDSELHGRAIVQFRVDDAAVHGVILLRQVLLREVPERIKVDSAHVTLHTFVVEVPAFPILVPAQIQDV